MGRGLVAISSLLCAICVFQALLAVHGAHKQTFVAEFLMIVDHSTYTRFYEDTDSSWPANRRENETETFLRKYVASIIHTTNTIFETLEPYNVSLRVKLVDVVIKKTVQESAFTEDHKNGTENGSVVINRSDAIAHVANVSQELQRSIPHDHAMVMTEYRLSRHTNGTLVVGYAYVGYACTRKSVSLVSNEGFESATTIAHEFGHNIGMEHDSDGNNCTGGYIMDAVNSKDPIKKWKFSRCSADYARNYFQSLIAQHENCLNNIVDQHVDPTLLTLNERWYGTVFDHNEQCRIAFGKESNVCREVYSKPDVDPSDCGSLYCTLPNDINCYAIEAGDGTTCGKNKWCMKDVCTASPHPINVTDLCFAGEVNYTIDNLTCEEIGRDHRAMCERNSVRMRCCYACADYGKLLTSPTDIDGQCQQKLTSASSFCRTASTYTNNPYQDIVCSKMYCRIPDDLDNCELHRADDHTACGFKKWCINGTCIHNEHAPAVPDDCPWGDDNISPFSVDGKPYMCKDVTLPINNYLCYTDFVAKRCCDTCNSLKSNKTGCEYGDKDSSCTNYFPTDGSSPRPSMCYTAQNADICCASCAKYRTNIVGCEYGDKLTGCQRAQCDRYNGNNLKGCCETCKDHAATIVG
ncbi:A disintegrin and metalloproteinase with thrombospondin motifs adt-1-like isoform X2 [Mya arenaria]|uniref:A disintegrin and metalloproteinase with thrombospondin motifs adt-1-like isoform X2 n=1 Tax=Mya arenaria TaxID=6604 RepID=UPI0022E3ADFE|nr:A disintegrin and metalloproteinase with thrombospondin motifs adt-1-like isoform X2 [Mya arenaria]